MTWRLDIRPDALVDIDEAAAWYEERRPHLGGEFVHEVRAAINRLPAYPLVSCVRHRSLRVRWIFPARFPYRIVYRVEDEKIIVLAVIHSARADTAWKDRR